MPLKVLVVGAGITGLVSALSLQRNGHSVTILERHPDIQNIGGPISIRPAAVRALKHYGLGHILSAHHEPVISTWMQRRYADGSVINRMNQSQFMEKSFGEESVGFARPKLQLALMEEVQKRGIEVRFETKVVGVVDNAKNPGLRLQSGEVLNADLIIGADGIGSITRRSIMKEDEAKISSLLSAYIVRIPISAVQNDPELAPYLGAANFWWGPGRMVIATKLEQLDILELHFYIDKELGEPGVWEKSATNDEVKEAYEGWDPAIFKMLDHCDTPNCWVWRISGMAPLPSWISQGGRVVILGDASHAMVPYASQGASQGIEDAVVLAECLERGEADLTRRLKIFEKIRKPRAEAAVEVAARNMRQLHLPDGPGQRERDEWWKSGKLSSSAPTGRWNREAWDTVPDLDGNPFLAEAYLMGHDAISYAHKILDQEIAAQD